MHDIVELTNVTKIYQSKKAPDVVAVDDFSLKVMEGEFVSICGVSGSGKSTLLHLIGCLDRPTKGSVVVNGVDTGTLSEKQMAIMRNETIGIVLQEFGLIPYRTVFDNIAVPLYFSKHKKSETKNIKEVMNLVGINDLSTRLVSRLSGGQKQRVAIARALVNDAPILLADEPTGQLDVKTTKEIGELFLSLNRLGKTIIMVTHNRNMAKIADRIVYISDGKETTELL